MDTNTPAAKRADTAPNSFYEWRLRAIIVGSILVLTGLFASPILRGRIPIWGDLGVAELPGRHFYAHCLQQGEAFDWMPGIFGGLSLTGDGGMGPYHPLHWLMFRWLPLVTAFDLEVFLPIVLLIAGMVFFLRKYVDLTSACLGALVVGFSVKFLYHLSMPPITTVLSHIPWLLAAMDGAVEGRTPARRRWACIGIAMIVASQLLLGHPETTWISLVLVSLYATCKLVTARARWTVWAAVIGSGLLGLGLASVQILTTYSAFVSSVRAGTDSISMALQDPDSNWSFQELVVPDADSRWRPHYFGAVPLMLGLWWITAAWMRPKTAAAHGGEKPLPNVADDREKAAFRLSVWALVAFILTFVFSFGLAGKLYYLFVYLPVVGKFRIPYYYANASQIVLGIVTALAFSRLLSQVRDGRKAAGFHLALPWLAVGLSVLATVRLAMQQSDALPRHFIDGRLYVGPLVVIGAAAGLTLAARGRQVGLLLLVVLAVVDSCLYGVGDGMVGKPYWRHLPTYQEYLAAHPGPQVPCEGRVHDERYFVGLCPVADQLCLHGFRTIDGYAGLTPQRCLHYGSDINALRVAQVQVGRFWPPDLKWFGNHLGPPQGDDWRTVDGALPRVRLVTQAIPSIAPGDDLAKIPVETAALVSHPIDLPVSAPGTAELIEDRPGKISVAATAPQRQLLVLSEGYDTGWQVRIDRQPAMLERINGDFFGCVMDGGTHRVDFEYAPAGLRTGKIVSLFALLLTLLLAFGPLGAALLYSRLDRRQSIVVA